MVNVGDRIRLSSMKGLPREGVVTAVTGSLMRVRWSSEEETTLTPAPGTLTVLAAGGAAPSKAVKKKDAAGAKPGAKAGAKPGAKQKSASKSAAPKKNVARKA